MAKDSEQKSGKGKKIAIGVVVAVVVALLCVIFFATQIPGCASSLSEIRGDLIGNSFVITTYDNYGEPTLRTSGKRINLSGNKIKTSDYSDSGNAYESYELSSVITITIDGKELETCGDTCIFAESGLNPELDFTSPEFIESHGGSPLSITSLSYELNQYKNFFGKRRVVVIKSQLGQPIVAYSGNNVYWEVDSSLPQTTKLMLDGKALYIHRANFQIIDMGLIEE